jgi:hypothetical protein
MEELTRLARVCTKLPRKGRRSDFSYWQKRTYLERLEALEEIRREYHLWKHGAEPRLQRVLAVAER